MAEVDTLTDPRVVGTEVGAGPDEPAVDLGYTVSVEAFSGPLDLLLFLVRKSELDIIDIPVAVIADQFVALIALWQQQGELDLEGAGDFILMAATLLEIKARTIAPPPLDEGEVTTDDDDDVLDPRADLIGKLLAYRRFKEAVGLLNGLEAERTHKVLRQTREEIPEDPDEAAGIDLGELDVTQLSKLWHTLLVRIGGGGPRTVMKDDMPIEGSIRKLTERAGVEKKVTLRQLFDAEDTLQGRVSILMATLECTRQRIVHTQQFEQYGNVELDFRDEADRVITAVVFPPEEPGKKRRKRPPLVTYHAPVAPTTDELEDAPEQPEEKHETDEERFLRELNETCDLDNVLARVVDVEKGFQQYWEVLHPPAPKPEPVVVIPPETKTEEAAPAAVVVEPVAEKTAEAIPEPVAIEPAALVPVADPPIVAEAVVIPEVVAPVAGAEPVAELSVIAIEPQPSVTEATEAAIVTEAPVVQEIISEAAVVAVETPAAVIAPEPIEVAPPAVVTDHEAVALADTSTQPSEPPVAVVDVVTVPDALSDASPAESPVAELTSEPAVEATAPSLVEPASEPIELQPEVATAIATPPTDAEPIAELSPTATSSSSDAAPFAVSLEPVIHVAAGVAEDVLPEPQAAPVAELAPVPESAPVAEMASLAVEAIADDRAPVLSESIASDVPAAVTEVVSAPVESEPVVEAVMTAPTEMVSDEPALMVPAALVQPSEDAVEVDESPVADHVAEVTPACEPGAVENVFDVNRVVVESTPIVSISAALSPVVAPITPAPSEAMAPAIVAVHEPVHIPVMVPRPINPMATEAPRRPWTRTLLVLLAGVAGGTAAGWWLTAEPPTIEIQPPTVVELHTSPIVPLVTTAVVVPPLVLPPLPPSMPVLVIPTATLSPELMRLADGTGEQWLSLLPAPQAAWPIVVPWTACLPHPTLPADVAAFAGAPCLTELPVAAFAQENAWAWCASGAWTLPRVQAVPELAFVQPLLVPTTVEAWAAVADLRGVPVTVFAEPLGWTVLCQAARPFSL